MKHQHSWIYLFYSMLWVPTQSQTVAPDLTKKKNITLEEYDPLSVLGMQDLRKLKSSWSLTVNDQCLYEFVYQFEHPDDFPIGDEEHKGKCDFGTMMDPVKPKIAPDKKPYLKPRRYWERFPDYVWATMGFNHMSVDWQACGRKPAGYRQPSYDMTFYRVTPEYRVENMVCKMYDDKWMTIVPHHEYCYTEQDDVKGMNFFIVPGAMMNRNPVVNMPFDFSQRKETFGPMPYEGMRAWDESRVPEKPDDWKHLEVFMSSYAGNVVSWQTHIPYKFINGEKRQFHSLAHRYWETTIQTLPDTWAVKYDERDGKIYFTLVGKAEICRGDFERAQEAAGGPPIFPNYEEEEVTSTEAPESESEDVDSNVELEKTSSGSFASIATTMILQVMMIALSLKQYL